MTNLSNAEIMEKGFNCLLQNLGTVETERFISTINRERFDYTQWRRQYFENVDPEDFLREAAEYAKAHPFQPKRELKPIE